MAKRSKKRVFFFFYLDFSRLSCQLFVMPNPHLNPIVLQLCRNSTHICLAIMIREQHFWFDRPCCIDELLNRHRIRLVAGEEGDIDVFDAVRLWDVFSVAGNVDSQSVESEDEAVVSSLWVKL